MTTKAKVVKDRDEEKKKNIVLVSRKGKGT
jgi:hypothetical protein